MKKTIYCFLIVLLFSFKQMSIAQEYDPPVFTDSLLQTYIYKPSVTTVITDEEGFDNFFLGTDFAEPHLAENPNSVLEYFTALNTNNTHYTYDALNWQSAQPSFANYTMRGDPITAYDAAGNLYYMNMYGDPIQGALVMRSTDNGATWGNPAIAVSGADKCWMAADQTDGPYANYIYASMTAGGGNGNFSRSSDYGDTWQHMYTFSTQSLPGMMVAVGPNVLNGNDISGGCVYVVTNGGSSTASTYTFYCSTDGGSTFSQMSAQNFAGYVGSFVNGRHSVENMRTRPYPFITADNSSGSYRGRLYLVYATNDPAGEGNKPDIFCRYSDDQGVNWSSAIRINDDANPQDNHQWMPAIWCDFQSGRLYVKWQDTRRCPTSDSADVYVSYSDDGGETWAANQMLTTEKFKINCTTCGGGGTPRYQGDYDAIISNSVSAMAVWSDYRDGRFDTYTAFFPDFAMKVSPDNYTASPDETFEIVLKVPVVKVYSQSIYFTVENDPSSNFTFSFPEGDMLTTFPDSLPLVISVNNTPEGDYEVKIKGQGPNGTPVHERSIFISIVEPIDITFINRIQSTTDFGKLVVDDDKDNPISSGTPVPFMVNTSHNVRTNELPFLPDWKQSGKTEKHHHFYSENYDHSLNHYFEVKDTEPVVQDANFVSTEPVVIQTELISGGEGGEIELKDPWRYYQDENNDWEQSDQFLAYSSPLNIGNTDLQSYGGVFLDQSGPPDWQPPYYSVRAEAGQTIPFHSQNITWYFQGWEGNDVEFRDADQTETAVVFKIANAEVTAAYKGHLASNNSRATGYNNGRRMARVANGKLHLVYEDNGNIWYTSSANGGASWTNEQLIGDPDSEDETFPAITFYDNKLFVTWIENWGDLCMIWFREKDLATGGDWSAIEEVLEFSTDENQKKPTASIAVLRRNGYPEYSVIIAYDFYESGPYVEDGYKIKMLKKDSDEQIFYPLDFEQFGYRPSLSADTYHSIQNQQMGLSYDNEGKIYFRQCNSDLQWTDPEQVSQDEAWKENERKSCLSMMNGHAHIVWEGKNIETGKWEIFYRDYRGPLNTTDDTGPKYIINPGPTVTSPIYYDVTNPTVGVNEYQEVAIFYSKNGNIYKKKLLGDDWIREYYDSGNYPAIVAHQLSGTAWTKYTSAPYFIRDDHNGPQSEPLDPVWHPDWTIDEKIIKYDYNLIADPPNSTDSYISIDILNVSIDNDTLQFTNTLRSDSMQITGNYLPLEIDMKVKFVNAENAMDDQEILYKVEFIDGADTLNMTNLRYHELPPAAGDTVERLFKHTTLVNMDGRTGHVQFNFQNHTPLINLILKENDNYNLIKNDHGLSLTITPEAFRLNQNYPNPFNPLTHITVELAEDCRVCLEVFNIRGQRVDELMNGFRPQGIYQVYFDGSGLSSGVYIYRLTTGKGTVLTKKMCLLK